MTDTTSLSSFSTTNTAGSDSSSSALQTHPLNSCVSNTLKPSCVQQSSRDSGDQHGAESIYGRIATQMTLLSSVKTVNLQGIKASLANGIQWVPNRPQKVDVSRRGDETGGYSDRFLQLPHATRNEKRTYTMQEARPESSRCLFCSRFSHWRPVHPWDRFCKRVI